MLVFGSRTKVFLSKLLVAIEKLFISVKVDASPHAITLQSTYHLVIRYMPVPLPSLTHCCVRCVVHSVTPWSPRTTLNWLLMLWQLPSSPLPCSVQQQHCTVNHCNSYLYRNCSDCTVCSQACRSQLSDAGWKAVAEWLWTQHTVTYAHSEFNCQSVVCRNGPSFWPWKRYLLVLKRLRNKKSIFILFISVIYLAVAGHSIQNKHTQYTSHMPTQVFCMHKQLRYHITTGIGIGTRIGISAGKKYWVSEVSVNPGIGLSLAVSVKEYVKQL